jgi:hypothetical protein
MIELRIATCHEDNTSAPVSHVPSDVDEDDLILLLRGKLGERTPLITAHVLQCEVCLAKLMETCVFLCALESLRSWPHAEKTETTTEWNSARWQLEFSDEYRSKAVWHA